MRDKSRVLTSIQTKSSITALSRSDNARTRCELAHSVRGQAVLLDLLFAVLIFFIIFQTINVMWSKEADSAAKKQEANDLSQKAFMVAEYLVKSQGKPADWQNLPVEDIEMVGLAKGQLSLDAQKVNAFRNLDQNYVLVKQLFFVPQYDYFFQLDGSLDVNAGLLPPQNAVKASVRRIVEFEGGEAVVIFTLYKVQ